MQAYIELFEFLAGLIDVQIKKYNALAKAGIGPDAGSNALLVANQVKTLLSVAHNLDVAIRSLHHGAEPHQSILSDAYNEIYFYLHMEHIRAHAGWLIDKNNIHTPVYQRVVDQRKDLAAIAEKFDLHFNTDFIKTSGQQQCEYDSYAIAYKILTFAIDLKTNPQIQFPAGTPDHVQKILRAHIATPTSRYNQEEIWGEIQDLHKICKEYLDAHPHMIQTTKILQHSHAQQLASDHTKQLNELLVSFKLYHADSALFSPDHQWHNVAFENHSASEDNTSTTVPAPKTSYNHYAFYSIGMATAAAVSMFLYHLIYEADNNKTTPNILG